MNQERRQQPESKLRLQGYFAAVALVVLAIGAALVLRRLPHANLSLLFLLVVLVVAAVWGLWPSIAASVMGFLALNFFFTTPLHTLSVEEEGDLATLVFFLAMAALTGNLAARMRTEMALSREALGRVSTLLEFSRRIGGAVDADQALAALSQTLAHAFGAPVSAWLPDANGTLRLRTRSPAGPGPDVCAQARLDAVWRSEPRGVAIVDGASIVPLMTAGRRLGLVAIGAAAADDEQRALTDGLCEQTSIALERTMLVDDLREAQLVSQTEQLRSALLSSVSHDLRTPLASIIGSVTSVLEYQEILKLDDQRALLETVLDESQRLNRYIQNLLDMTRFGGHDVELRREWVDLNDLISAAIERLGTALAHVQLDVAISPDVCPIFVQGALIEQVLVNVLDNAAGFSAPGDLITVACRRANGASEASVIEVADQGPGIPARDRAKVFDMFYSVQHGDRRRHGVGLGLAICRSIVEAHGGTIAVLAGAGGTGTLMRIALPVSVNPVGEPA